MKRAILHIGTEKTGTTSIQKFLFDNRAKLNARGVLFPSTAGYISNQNLVVYGKQKPERDISPEDLDVEDPVDIAQWKENFVLSHCAEVLAFQAQAGQNSSVVYSAEHLQSRFTRIDEIKRVARLLRPLFDNIQIVVYIRRQDKYAMSAHSTSVRGGNPKTFSFTNINSEGPYYNYRELLDNWSSVYGQNAITVRIYEKSRLFDGDVVSDFIKVAGIEDESHDLSKPAQENEALSHTALSVLRLFNSLAANDPRLLNHSKPQLRPYLLQRVESIRDDHGRQLPSREAAEQFYAAFKKDNQWIAETWLNGDGFDEQFLDYPEVEITPPEVAGLNELLDELVSQFGNKKFGLSRKIA